MQQPPLLTTTITVPDRQLIAVTGSDGLDFLQKLASNDLQPLSDADGLIYTLLLNAQGRYLYDFFVLRQAGQLYLDCAAGQAESLLALLNRYKLRADVLFARLEGQHLQLNKDGEGFADPRQATFGWRHWQPGTLAANDAYERYRISRGIVEPSLDLQSGSDLPLEYGLGQLNATSFTKGCYPGQELTARMQHRDQARHRIEHLELRGDYTAGTEIHSNSVRVGKIIAAAAPFYILQLRKELAADAPLTVSSQPLI